MANGESTTAKLTEILKRARTDQVESVLRENEDMLADVNYAFSDHVRAAMKLHGVNQKEVFQKADIPERYGYKLVSGQKSTLKRDVLLRIFLAAGFTLDEVQRALKLAELPELYPRFKRDAVLMIAVNRGLSLPEDADELLIKNGFAPLDRCGEE